MNCTDVELAWAAGFFEGEGWVTHSNSKSLRVAVSQSYGRDEVERFGRAVKLGRLYGPYGTAKGRVRWDWGANGVEAHALITKLESCMTQGSKKLKKYRELVGSGKVVVS